ncbi:MAG: TonB family protein [Candidatus Acidiferrales bacterium]
MSETQGNQESTLAIPDRRMHARRPALPLAYVELGENNGGIVLNISAGGLAFAAVEVIHEEHLPKMRFQLPQTNIRVEATGQIAWTGESKKAAGVRFVDLSEEAAAQINGWLSSEAAEPVTPPHRDDVHATARRPFTSLMAPEPPATAPAIEKHVTAPVPGSSFAAALQRTRAPAATLFPEQPAEAPEESKDAQAGQIFSTTGHHSAPERRWWALTALVSLFAVISFVAGMATGGGGWDGVLRLIAGKSAGERESAKALDTSDGSRQPIAPASVPGGAPEISSATPSTKSRDPNGPSPNPAANRTPVTPTSPTPAGRAAQRENSALLLQLSESPISASASVAITSRRSVQVAPDRAPPTAQQAQNIQIGQLFYRVEPFYPPDAERQGIEGTVLVHASVGRDGKVRSAEILSGPPQLGEAAVNSVREWRYKPTLLNGQPIESDVDVKMTFRLPPR